MIADLQVAAAEAPAGKARWSLRTYLADAMYSASHPDQALPLYEQAAEEAETATHWADVRLDLQQLGERPQRCE